MRGEGISESLLAQVWRRAEKWRLVTTEGEEIEVIYPGRENSDSGPDFQDAIIVGRRGLIKGDVELHIRSSDWSAHGHHRDPRYNGVVLQVVLWSNGRQPAMLENGAEVPTLTLSQYCNDSLEEIRRWASFPMVPSEPCYQAVERLGNAALGRILAEAGMERFWQKAARFQGKIDQGEAEQALYQGIMRALGYAQNKEQFQRLARYVPLSFIRDLIQGEMPPRQHLILQALLLGKAGLLPSQCGIRADEQVTELEEVWRSLNAVSVMNYTQWHFFRMHPENLPTRRLIAASYLIWRFEKRGLVQGVLDLVTKGQKKLEAGFMVTASGYCGEHFAFGHGAKNPYLIGRSRAQDIVVNAILPFTFAWAELTFQPELKEHALGLYQGYPKLSENKITRRMSGLLFAERGCSVVNSAQRQQGLLHLYDSFCKQRNCIACPLAALIPA